MVIVEQYEFLLDQKVIFRLPKNAKIIDVKLFGGTGRKFFMWAIIENEAPLETRVLSIFPNRSQLEGKKLIHLKTITTGEGFVWHIFENLTDEENQTGN